MKMGGKGFETLAHYLESSYTSLRPKCRDLPEGFWVAHQAFYCLPAGHWSPPSVTAPTCTFHASSDHLGVTPPCAHFFTNALLSSFPFQRDHDSTYVHHSYCISPCPAGPYLLFKPSKLPQLSRPGRITLFYWFATFISPLVENLPPTFTGSAGKDLPFGLFSGYPGGTDNPLSGGDGRDRVPATHVQYSPLDAAYIAQPHLIRPRRPSTGVTPASTVEARPRTRSI